MRKAIFPQPDHLSQLESMNVLQSPRAGRVLAKWLGGVGIFLFLVLFLPWQQNINATGEVTALSPENRPQTIQSAIPGQITNWLVNEGEYVQEGDTILTIRDVKDKFFDPQLLPRLQEQIEAKVASIDAKEQKAEALERQIAALRDALRLKLKQARNKVRQSELKVVSDSTDFIAEGVNANIADNQFERQQVLYDEGLKSLTELQQKEQKAQQAQAKLISSENKFYATQNELYNAQIELNSIEADYLEKISKAESDLSLTRAELAEAAGSLIKQRNEYANVEERLDRYSIIAPQDGFVVKALKTGIGETIKEGEGVVTVMPRNPDKAVELYVRPMDVPLLETGRHVRLEFDGWPALQFSGWPSVAVGTFGGIVKVIDFVETDDKAGKYRILVTPDPSNDGDWPEQLRLGSGVKGFAMLNDVPLWYELWRLYNGFPPSLEAEPDMKNADVKTASK
ncbi:HlyD family secretion protein [Tunicatimonas pelagia]|uniref:HlyD family secretion protein n=1 Tax=Tunicatimonas pelagia TaxID=931531 RepID=UPI002664FCD5|nr:biotin/lipoyl-binding protein [Tunicatimonas pelagia]WKN41928.1 HlyD family efflux transporter periplasmic adaptor subunit [Tunicatimonas pelagia]